VALSKDEATKAYGDAWEAMRGWGRKNAYPAIVQTLTGQDSALPFVRLPHAAFQQKLGDMRQSAAYMEIDIPPTLFDALEAAHAALDAARASQASRGK